MPKTTGCCPRASTRGPPPPTSRCAASRPRTVLSAVAATRSTTSWMWGTPPDRTRSKQRCGTSRSPSAGRTISPLTMRSRPAASFATTNLCLRTRAWPSRTSGRWSAERPPSYGLSPFTCRTLLRVRRSPLLPLEPAFWRKPVHEAIYHLHHGEVVDTVQLADKRPAAATKCHGVAGLVVDEVVPVAAWHVERVPCLERDFVSFGVLQPGEPVEIRPGHIDVAAAGERVAMQVFALRIRKQIHRPSAMHDRVQHVRHVDVEMHLRDRAFAAEKHEDEIFRDAVDEIRNADVLEQFRNLVANVVQEHPQILLRRHYEVDIVAQRQRLDTVHVVATGRHETRIVDLDLLVAMNLTEEIRCPLRGCGPTLRQ